MARWPAGSWCGLQPYSSRRYILRPVVAVDEQTAENQIILSPGSNQALPSELIAPFLASAQPGDWALAQNEVNLTEAFLRAAKQKNLHICYSAAPFCSGYNSWPFAYC